MRRSLLGCGLALAVMACGGAREVKAPVPPAPVPCATSTTTPTPTPQVREALADATKIIQAQCLDCHGRSSDVLNLEDPIAISDAKTWNRIHVAISIFKMPPAREAVVTKESDLSELFPLELGVRSRFLHDIETLLASSKEPDKTALLSADEQLELLNAVFVPLIGRDVVHETERPLLPQDGIVLQMGGLEMRTLKLRTLALGLCRAYEGKVGDATDIDTFAAPLVHTREQSQNIHTWFAAFHAKLAPAEARVALCTTVVTAPSTTNISFPSRSHEQGGGCAH